MNMRTISKLVLKDWHMHRIAIRLTVVGSALAVLLVLLKGIGMVNVGSNLSLAVLISIIFYLPLASVIEERHDKTLTFLMALPISPSEYVASKIVGNLSIFLLPWITVVAGMSLLPEGEATAALSSGFVPVIMVGVILCFSLVLGFSLITESGGWTVTITVSLLFLTSNIMMELIPDTAAVRSTIESIDQRGGAFRVAIGIELFLIVSLLAATFVVQSRKKDFL